MRRAEARVDLEAVEANVARLRGALAGGTQLCAVVKADAYGHGAVPCALAAQTAGATWLAVATAGEAAALRAGGVEGPVLVMGAVSDDELDAVVDARADLGVWSLDQIERLGDRPVRVHVKLDTGMGRLGTRDPAEADAVATAAGDRLVALWTHFATADERGDAFFGEQLERFRTWALPWKARRPELLLHAANSAATLRDPACHFDLVRCGVAVYGMDPFGVDPAAQGLRPALELRSYVAAVKRAEPGDSVGYGRRFVAAAPTWLATVPIGYGDGWRRGLTNDADVVIDGRRYPSVGTVSMDNITADLGPETEVRAGAPAVLIGEGILAEEVARRLGTINYEVTTGLTVRVPRVHHRGGAPAGR